MNIADLQARKERGEPIVMLTCYDYPTAQWQEAAGVDIVFCADSLGTNLLGYADEREVTMEAVRRGLTGTGAYLLADLPYGSCETPEAALGNALRFRALGADGVKFEGFKPEVVRRLRERGIDVCCHLGLNPQLHESKRVQARTSSAAATLLEESLALEAAGAQLLVLEAIPERVARAVSRRLRIPTIGIAAGRHTDGQVLVVTDLLGMHDLELRHARRYAELRRDVTEAMRRFVDDVRARRFPADEHVWRMKAEEAAAFDAWLEAHPG